MRSAHEFEGKLNLATVCNEKKEMQLPQTVGAALEIANEVLDSQFEIWESKDKSHKSLGNVMAHN